MRGNVFILASCAALLFEKMSARTGVHSNAHCIRIELGTHVWFYVELRAQKRCAIVMQCLFMQSENELRIVLRRSALGGEVTHQSHELRISNNLSWQLIAMGAGKNPRQMNTALPI